MFWQHIAQCGTECCHGQGGICPPSNLLCPRTRRRFVIHYSSCGLGLQILEQDSSIFPFSSISVHLHRAASLPLLMLQWLLMALLQSYPSIRNMPCPQNLETPWGFFCFCLSSECWNACVARNCFLFSVTLFWVVTYTDPDVTYTALFSLNACLVLHSCNY